MVCSFTIQLNATDELVFEMQIYCDFHCHLLLHFTHAFRISSSLSGFISFVLIKISNSKQMANQKWMGSMCNTNTSVESICLKKNPSIECLKRERDKSDATSCCHYHLFCERVFYCFVNTQKQRSDELYWSPSLATTSIVNTHMQFLENNNTLQISRHRVPIHMC